MKVDKMKYTILTLALVATTAHANTFIVDANVLEVTPRYVVQNVSKQVCEMVNTPVKVTYPGQVVYRKTNTGRLLLNTAIGAAIGNQFGKGKGNDAATIAGGLIGYGLTEPDIRYSNNRTVTEYRQVEQCNTVYDQVQVQQGYIVKYDYNGLTGTKVTDNYPDETISVTIKIGE
jgi:uncharacterized protein YcfJ